MDAETMAFPDNSFDFIWSWGVIHHSANTEQVIREIHRVLRPGGLAVTMVYHRSLWNTFVRGALYYGVLRGDLLKAGSLYKVIQRSTDGALARYYSIKEWRSLLASSFEIKDMFVLGHKSQIIPLPWGKAKQLIMGLLPNTLGRLATNRPSMGYLLVSSFRKRDDNCPSVDPSVGSPVS